LKLIYEKPQKLVKIKQNQLQRLLMETYCC